MAAQDVSGLETPSNVYQVMASILASQYDPERDRWKEDPITWAQDRAGVFVWSKQREILQALRDNNRVAVKSCHSAGKTYNAALAVSWWLDVHEPGSAFVITTAPTAPQVRALLWREIRRLHTSADLPGRTNQTEWHINEELVAFGRKPSEYNASAFQGIHAKYVLVVLDEACHDDETEVMTDQGWKLFADLDGSEELLTMDPKTHQARYTIPERIVRKPYQGRMLQYEGKGANWCVTPDHQMYFHGRSHNRDTHWRKDDAEDLAQADNKYLKKVIDWNKPDIPIHVIPSWNSERRGYQRDITVSMDDWMEFLGWYLSEGSLIKRGEKVVGASISQNDDATLIEIHELCQRMGFPSSRYPKCVCVHSTQIGRHLAEFGLGSLHKHVPEHARMASSRQINIFLDAFSRGDGYHKGNGREILYTSSPQLADHLQEMVLKTGKPSVVRSRKLAGKVNDFGTHLGTSSVDGYVISRPSRSSKAKHYSSNVEVIDYDGTVYCAHVPPDHLLFTRRRGYTMWSGNCGIPKTLWTAAESIASNRYSKILAIGNPDDNRSEFATACGPVSGWNVIHIPYTSTPNFTGEEVPEHLNDVLIDKGWVESRKVAWGEDSALFQSKCLGEFPSEDTNPSAVIPFHLVAKCRWVELPDNDDELIEAGIDVGAGGDRTIIRERVGNRAGREESFRSSDPMSTVGLLATTLEEWGVQRAKIDVIGIGWGIYGRLKELSNKHNPGSREATHNAEIVPVNFGGASSMPRRFANLRAEIWWNVGRELSRLGTWDLGEVNDDTVNELVMPEYEILDSYGRIKVEPKEKVRERLEGTSPDSAEALLLAFYDGHKASSIEPSKTLNVFRRASTGNGRSPMTGGGSSPFGRGRSPVRG